MRINICIIVGRYGDGDLEFSWEIRWSIQRLMIDNGRPSHLSLVTSFVVLQPNYVVGGSGGKEMVRDLLRDIMNI